jgi:hypothetical protein
MSLQGFHRTAEKYGRRPVNKRFIRSCFMKKSGAEELETRWDMTEDDIGEIFPVREIKEFLEKHGYTMESIVGTRHEAAEDTIVIHITRRNDKKDGITAFAGFSHDG